MRSQRKQISIFLDIPCKTKQQWAESYRASLGRQKIGVSSASPTDPEKGRANKRRKKYADLPSEALTMDKK